MTSRTLVAVSITAAAALAGATPILGQMPHPGGGMAGEHAVTINDAGFNPAEMVVAPAWLPVPVSSSVPAPVLVNAPAPAMSPSWVSVMPLLVAMVPPPGLSVVARSIVKLAIGLSVPPSKPRMPAAAPRLALLAATTVPPLIRVPPA